ncbi:hypothetical protein SAMN03159353_103453 [Cedecea sp. NFIX57]|nr:hypothetical protein SAMN03159353_103453 [Cedecea sp. NFIX57]
MKHPLSMFTRESEMRAGLPLAGLILMIPTLVWGTTLRLSADVDLLVLDGKRVSSSLLKGADSIEIDNV